MKSEPELAEERRRRQYRTTARVLKEYTVRLYRIANQLGRYLDNPADRPSGNRASWVATHYMWRVAMIRQEFQALALFASQMLVHYDLGEAEKADLTLRLADAEFALSSAEVVSGAFAEHHEIRNPLQKAPAESGQTSSPKNGATQTDRMPTRPGTLGGKPRP